jgi:predicted amidohydrolase
MTALPDLRVALAQTESVPGQVEENVLRSAELVAEAADRGARLVLFPELSLVDYDLDRLADTGSWVRPDDPRLDRVRDRCRAGDVHAVLGAGVVTGDGRRRLASLIIGPHGQVSVYAKNHLHGPERFVFDPGDDVHVVAVDRWQLAMAICYDAGVPAHAQRAAEAGAELYVVSSWHASDQGERMALRLGARAMDHRMFAIVANHAHSPTRDSCGASGVWGPDGTCRQRAGRQAELLVADLPRDELTHLRELDRESTRPIDRAASSLPVSG